VTPDRSRRLLHPERRSVSVEAHLGETGDFVRRAAISTKKWHFVLNPHPTLHRGRLRRQRLAIGIGGSCTVAQCGPVARSLLVSGGGRHFDIVTIERDHRASSMSPVLTRYRSLIGFSNVMSDKEPSAVRRNCMFGLRMPTLGENRRLFIRICRTVWGGELVAELLTTRCTAGN
jgi:hypothetical protein